MIEAKYNPDLNGKTKVTLEFNSNDERAFSAIFSSSLLGIGARSSGRIETSNPTHIRRIYTIGAENVHIDRDSLVAVGCAPNNI